MELLTLQQIADRLKIPASTVRHYNNQYKEFMPGVKSGRYLKYEPEAVEIIKDISAATAATMQQQEIKSLLSEKYALNIEQTGQGESTATTAATTATTQQQQTEIAIYKGYIQDMRSEVEFLRDELSYKDVILLKTIERLREAQEQNRRRRWWLW